MYLYGFGPFGCSGASTSKAGSGGIPLGWHPPQSFEAGCWLSFKGPAASLFAFGCCFDGICAPQITCAKPPPPINLLPLSAVLWTLSRLARPPRCSSLPSNKPAAGLETTCQSRYRPRHYRCPLLLISGVGVTEGKEQGEGTLAKGEPVIPSTSL